MCGTERARIRIRCLAVNVFRMNVDTGEELLHCANDSFSMCSYSRFLWFYINSIVFAPLRYYLYLCSFHFSWLQILLISTESACCTYWHACVLQSNLLVWNHMKRKKERKKNVFCWIYLKINQSYTYTVSVRM